LLTHKGATSFLSEVSFNAAATARRRRCRVSRRCDTALLGVSIWAHRHTRKMLMMGRIWPIIGAN
jgi:hypothetical protein